MRAELEQAQAAARAQAEDADENEDDRKVQRGAGTPSARDAEGAGCGEVETREQVMQRLRTRLAELNSPGAPSAVQVRPRASEGAT